MVLSFLGHISFRIWAAVFFGGPVSLFVLPIFQSRFGLESTFLAAVVILLFFFLATGWVLNRWALNTADYLMAEASAFERDGMYHEAKNSFQKAPAHNGDRTTYLRGLAACIRWTHTGPKPSEVKRDGTQVRVSHFATKQRAGDYGEKLKAEGVIEDYYVGNYRRP